MIRKLKSSDIAEVMILAKAMHEESPFYNRYPFSEEKITRLYEVFLQNPDWLCVVAELNEKIIGFLAVTIVPTFFGDARFVEDISFYVEPKYRGTSAALRLVRFVEEWAIMQMRSLQLELVLLLALILKLLVVSLCVLAMKKAAGYTRN
jgi:GNAT superfamily N-acetyltransferase